MSSTLMAAPQGASGTPQKEVMMMASREAWKRASLCGHEPAIVTEPLVRNEVPWELLPGRWVEGAQD